MVKKSIIWYMESNAHEGNGTLEKPFGTFDEVSNSLSKTIRNHEGIPLHICIYLREGTYYVDKPIVLTKNECGGDNISINFCAFENENVVISGGTPLCWEDFYLVTDETECKRLHKNAIGKVYAINLKGTRAGEDLQSKFNDRPQDTVEGDKPNVTDLANISVEKYYNILVSNGYCLQQAKYPNNGYAHVKEIVEKGCTTRFIKPGETLPKHSFENPIGAKCYLYEDVAIDKWQQELAETHEVYLEGHFSNDWYTDENYMASISSDGLIQFLKAARYGLEYHDGVPRRISFINLLCELDEKGEWYYDKNLERLYVIPIDLADGVKPEFVVPKRMHQLFLLDHVSNVSLENLTITDSTKIGVEIIEGSFNKVAGCTIKNIVEFAVCIKGGHNHGVQSCNIYDVNQAVYMKGGDFKTLEPCNHYMYNNDIYRCKIRGYGMCNIQGVGLTLKNNLFHDMNGSVAFKTVNGILEKNEFYNIGFEMGDFNVAYFGVDFFIQGNEMKHNFIHHMMRYNGIYHLGGLRCDGEGMGVNFFGNVFYKAGAYGVASHGAMNIIKNNIAIETPSVWYTQIIDDEGVQERLDVVKASREGKIFAGDTGDLIYRMEQVIGEKGWEKEPWISRFPKLKETMDINPWIQVNNVISHNYMTDYARCGFEFHGAGINYLPKEMIIEFPKKISKDAFVDPEHLNFAFKKDFKAMPGFETIPFEEIGLYIDQYRLHVPDKDTYRSSIKKRFEGIGSNEEMIFDVNTANEMYAKPSYL